MKSYHRIVVLSGLFCALLVVAGCGGGGNDQSGEDGDLEQSEADIIEADGEGPAEDGEPAPDGDEPDGDGETVADGDAEAEVADAEGEAADAEAAPQGPLMVKVMEEGDTFLSGPEAVGIPGDYLIANEKVRFIIQGENRPRSWVPYTGTLVDADVARGEGEAGADTLGEVSMVNGMVRAFCPDSFEIVSDGRDGVSAALRVIGHDCGIPIIDAAIPFAAKGYYVIVDYELAAEDIALKITTTIPDVEELQTITLGDGLVWGNRLTVLTPGFGWGLEGISAHGEFPYQMVYDHDIAYGYLPLGGPTKVLIDQADFYPYVGFSEKVFPGEDAVSRRLFIVARTVEELRARILAEKGVEHHKLTVTVETADAQDAAEPGEVVIYDEEGIPLATVYLPATTVTFELEPGTYTVGTLALGRPAGVSDPVTIADADATATVTLPATGRVDYAIGGDHFDGTVKDGLPCRIGIQAGADAGLLDPVLRRVWSATGSGTILLEPGTYTFTASRGYEYEMVRQNVTVTASQTVEFNGTLERSVDTSGWLAGDFHMHTERSIDTGVVVEDRVVQLAAVGLERMPITDHDTISVLDPLVDVMGVRDFLRLSTGCEVSPPWAHTNGYPMTDRADSPAYYGVMWYKGYDADGNFAGLMTMPEIWTHMRDDFAAGIRQSNHPRGGSSYFDAIDYDPALGITALEAGVFSDDFEAMELINSGGVDDTLATLLTDWYSFLNQGIHLAGMSNSDSHTDGNPGDGRTYFRTGEDDPNAVSDEDMVNAINGLHVQATTGPFLVATIGEAGGGDTYTGAGPYDLDVTVQAPSWMPLEWVRVIVNGTQVEERVVTGTDPLRFQETIALTGPGGDFWVVVLTGATTNTLSAVNRGLPPLAIASPIFVDADGGGYTPPGLPSVRHADNP